VLFTLKIWLSAILCCHATNLLLDLPDDTIFWLTQIREDKFSKFSAGCAREFVITCEVTLRFLHLDVMIWIANHTSLKIERYDISSVLDSFLVWHRGFQIVARILGVCLYLKEILSCYFIPLGDYIREVYFLS